MKKFGLFIVLVAVSHATSGIKAQEVTVSAGADIVSSYIWRGLYAGPASVQPGISLSAGNFSVGVWGSTSFESSWREFDLYAGYSIGNFSVLVTDYFFPHDLHADGSSDYFDYSEHLFEATLGYSLGESLPLSLAWNTNFAGDDDYSSYFEASYTLPVRGVNVDLILGATPWEGAYSNGFALINASVKASKDITITDSFSLPVFTQAIVNPDTKDVFLVFGMSF
ncbi:TorF family putative porin [uncultured Proteiniphilum sp.]|uniref:TorF family putative porin n=1 Tax=uncultured Proteiniphilum sp. TaxID=497637 RepID=UPI00260C9052|nr:TorF family putative porin [uncultured Proteiniphilum sp.]